MMSDFEEATTNRFVHQLEAITADVSFISSQIILLSNFAGPDFDDVSFIGPQTNCIFIAKRLTEYLSESVCFA